jgi:hypothetical protein
VEDDPYLPGLFRDAKRNADWIQSPNDAPDDSQWASRARSHSDFDDDRTTLQSTLMRILQPEEEVPQVHFERTEASVKNRRLQLSD